MQNQSPSLNPKYLKKTEPSKSPARNHRTHAAITIGKPIAEVYAFFRDFTNLPKFMKDLSRVEVLDEKTSHWILQMGSGREVKWKAVITEERENEMIAWKTTEGSDVKSTGNIWFCPSSGLREATVIELAMDAKVPGGFFGEAFAALTGESPNLLALTNLHRLKAVLETGEYPTTAGQPSGRDDSGKAPAKEPKSARLARKVGPVLRAEERKGSRAEQDQLKRPSEKGAKFPGEKITAAMKETRESRGGKSNPGLKVKSPSTNTPSSSKNTSKNSAKNKGASS